MDTSAATNIANGEIAGCVIEHYGDAPVTLSGRGKLLWAGEFQRSPAAGGDSKHLIL